MQKGGRERLRERVRGREGETMCDCDFVAIVARREDDTSLDTPTKKNSLHGKAG